METNGLGRRFALVLTTVGVPELLLQYADNFDRYDHRDEVDFIVVGDLKTPSGAEEVIRKLNQRGFRGIYLDVPAQDKWLSSFEGLKDMIPYNSDNRRNVGFLMALDRGADAVVSLDDDSYVLEEDYLKAHHVLGRRIQARTAHSSNTWYNPCSLLTTRPRRQIYPRGFPYAKRWQDKITFSQTSGRVAINAGLWLGDPDVDAVTRLTQPVVAVKCQSRRVMLAPGTYSPINTQNTAFLRDVAPCFYYVVMGARIDGVTIDRYGDIWCGFLAKRVVDQVGDRVVFGPPLTDHRRNKHNLFKDLQAELSGMILTDQLGPLIQSIKLRASSYSEAYEELAEELRHEVDVSSEFTPGVKDYLRHITKCMRTWVHACHRVMG